MPKNMAKIRKRLWLQAGGVCHWCGVRTIWGASDGDPLKATVDHLYTRPRARAMGMSENLRNKHVVLACYGCNTKFGRAAQMADHKRQQQEAAAP
jgi:5-methylcytosine-specific restriction endonuclease McrA